MIDIRFYCSADALCWLKNIAGDFNENDRWLMVSPHSPMGCVVVYVASFLNQKKPQVFEEITIGEYRFQVSENTVGLLNDKYIELIHDLVNNVSVTVLTANAVRGLSDYVQIGNERSDNQ